MRDALPMMRLSAGGDRTSRANSTRHAPSCGRVIRALRARPMPHRTSV